MRRWRLLNRVPRDRDPRRVRLALEELEGREVLAPLVAVPFFYSPPQTLEGFSRVFPEYGETPFAINDDTSPTADYVVDATLSSTHGTLFVDGVYAESQGVSVAGNSGVAVTLTGPRTAVNNVLGFGFTFTPADGYSGDADISLAVADRGAPPATSSGSFVLEVVPRPLAWATGDEVRVRTEPLPFAGGFLSVGEPPVADGTEAFSVTLSLYDPSEREGEFTLSANGVPLPTVGGQSGLWVVEGVGTAAFQALLDSLVLTPPADYSGRVGLNAFGQVTFPSEGGTDTDYLSAGSVRLRFFEAARFTVPPAVVLEGTGPIDLGGRYSVVDPARLDEDSHALTLSVPTGTLGFNPAAMPAGVVAGRDGNTILLTGDLLAINQFLATPGGLTWTPPSPFFSGRVPLTLSLVNHPGEPDYRGEEGNPEGPSLLSLLGDGSSDPGLSPSLVLENFPPASVAVVGLSVVPVAGHAVPTAADAQTTQDTPVALTLALGALADTDGSESVLVMVDGVPAGATFNRGTNLGGGTWAFTPTDLAGLLFTPPPGATGLYPMTMRAVVTDTAPDLDFADTESDAVAFTVLVSPAAVVTPAPAPTNPVVSLPPTVADALFASDTSTPIVVGTSGVLPGTGGGAVATRAAESAAVAGFTAMSDAGAERGAPEARAELPASGPGSLFSPADAPAVNYPYADKHPLPPVAPLDQTNPVAVYADAGGDSFALVDKIYRDANGAAVIPPLGTTVGQSMGITFPTRAAVSAATPPAVEPPAAIAASQPDAAQPAAEKTASAPVESGANDWYAFAALGAAAGALGAWLARGWAANVARSVRRLLHTSLRHQPKGTA